MKLFAFSLFCYSPTIHLIDLHRIFAPLIFYVFLDLKNKKSFSEERKSLIHLEELLIGREIILEISFFPF